MWCKSYPLFRKICKAEKSRRAAFLIVDAVRIAEAVVRFIANLLDFSGKIATLLLIADICVYGYYNAAIYFAQGEKNNNGFWVNQA